MNLVHNILGIITIPTHLSPLDIYARLKACTCLSSPKTSSPPSSSPSPSWPPGKWRQISPAYTEHCFWPPPPTGRTEPSCDTLTGRPRFSGHHVPFKGDLKKQTVKLGKCPNRGRLQNIPNFGFPARGGEVGGRTYLGHFPSFTVVFCKSPLTMWYFCWK